MPTYDAPVPEGLGLLVDLVLDAAAYRAHTGAK